MASRAQKIARCDDSVNAGTSPFWRLPIEVRLMIYKYVIFSGSYKDHFVFKGDEPSKRAHTLGMLGPFKIRGKTRSGVHVLPAKNDRKIWHSTYFTGDPLAIAFACREIYLEAVPIWYANVRLGFPLLEHMKSYMRGIGVRDRDVIRHIRVCVSLPRRRQNDDVFEHVKILLSEACRCAPGLRTIVLIMSGEPSESATDAAKWILETRSLLEWITLSYGSTHTRTNRRIVYLANYIDIRRHENSEGLYHVHRQIKV